MTRQELQEKMKATARVLSTAQIVEAVKKLGGDHLPTAENMTRALLIDLYAEREGEEAADALMDEIGL